MTDDEQADAQVAQPGKLFLLKGLCCWQHADVPDGKDESMTLNQFQFQSRNENKQISATLLSKTSVQIVQMSTHTYSHTALSYIELYSIYPYSCQTGTTALSYIKL